MAKRSRVVECRSCKKLIRYREQYEGCCSSHCLDKIGHYPTTNSNGVEVRRIPTHVKGIPPNRPYVTGFSRRDRRQKKDQHDAFFKDQKWQELRYDVLTTYGRICMLCNKRTGAMHVDHIKPRSKYPELALIFDNLQVLCSDCNVGKLNRDETDLRPNSAWQKRFNRIANSLQEEDKVS